MMIHGYDEKYLLDAMNNLGEAFDYASNVCNIDIETFMRLFISTGFSKKFENGNPRVIVGYSGIELALEVISKSKVMDLTPYKQVEYEYSPEYWCGYIMAYYQWKTGKRFKDIHSFIDMHDVLKLYPTMHEAIEDKFVDTLNVIINKKNKTTKLQKQRKICGLTQKELSGKTNVNLRTLQQYETRAKDLNQAAISTIRSLARVLGCEVEDLVE